jgi:20S proteasome alpha/beta subunit
MIRHKLPFYVAAHTRDSNGTVLYTLSITPIDLSHYIDHINYSNFLIADTYIKSLDDKISVISAFNDFAFLIDIPEFLLIEKKTMTCIIGIECSNGVVIAGDYCASDEETHQNIFESKVFQYGTMVIGYSSSFHYGQLIQHFLSDFISESRIPTHDVDNFKWIVKYFIPAIKKILQEHECVEEGNLLIGLNNQVWMIDGSYSALRYSNKAVSIGSGCYHALSSALTQIHMMAPDNNITIQQAESMLPLIFKITANCCNGVSEKFIHFS